MKNNGVEMNILEEASVKVLSHAYKDSRPKFGIGLATIALLISAVVINFLTIEQKCQERKLNKIAQKKSWFHKRRVKKVIKTHLTTEQYKNESTHLINGLFDAAANSSDTEIDELVNKIKKQNKIV